MTTSFEILPFLISLPLGYLCIEFLFREHERPDPFIQFCLAAGLGLGLSSVLTFSSYLILDRLSRSFVVALHLAILLGLYFYKIRIARKSVSRWTYPSVNPVNGMLWVLLSLAMVPLVLEAVYYPYGGWDAWSVWNFKAKFLLLAGHDWRNLFDPVLWRSSPHYPLLLPLVNVWGWIFLKEPLPAIPMYTSLIFSFLSAGLLLAVLYHHTKSAAAVIAPLVLLTLPFYGTLATSQYSDVIVGFYLSAGLYCLMQGLELSRQPYTILAGIFLGLLTFTKPEGAMLTAIIIFTASFMTWQRRKTAPIKPFLTRLFLWAGIASLPAVIFLITCSPGNQTFINGFVSQSHPVTFYRVKVIGAFVAREFISGKWNALWLVVLSGMCLAGRSCWKREFLIMPLTIGFYMAVVLFYYATNTYFEITWWLAFTLNRILFSLLPAIFLWIFLAIGKMTGQKTKDGNDRPLKA